jgi:hypothetical protein
MWPKNIGNNQINVDGDHPSIVEIKITIQNYSRTA